MEATIDQLKQVVQGLEEENVILIEENNELKRVLRHLAQQLASAAIEVTDFLDAVELEPLN